jgi:hypothetical protein
VFGSRGKKKHENKESDSRVSITMYRTGSIAGCTGLTIVLLEGKARRCHFTDKLIMDNGAAIGSTVIMTPTDFMIEEAWDKSMPHIVKGLRNADPIMADNPQWWMLEVFNGFGLHTSSLKAMQYRADNKIIAVKEEGDSSHCNQAYDKFAAKSDKAAKIESVSMLHGTMVDINRAGVDQWGLIHVGLFVVRELKEETGTNSFRACNMDPHSQLSFDQWCKNIEGFLQAGETFKEEEPIYMYAMLHENRNMMNVIDSYGAVFLVDLYKALRTDCSSPFKEIHPMLMCYDLAKKHPEHLGMTLSTINNQQEEAHSDIVMAKAAVSGATSGLNSFLLKSDGLSGDSLFRHMVLKRLFDPKVCDHHPSSYLDIEFNVSHIGELGRSAKDLTKQRIMSFAGGHGAT